MNKDSNMRPNGNGQRELGSTPSAPGHRSAPLADREVPIAAQSPFEAMHRWLDGEMSATELSRDPETARHVELWRSLGAETERRGRERAPADLAARVMSALPGAATASQPQRVVEASVTAATATVVASRTTVGAAAAPAASSVTTSSWWERPIEMNVTTAFAAAAGLVTLGLVLGAVLKGQ